MLIKNFKATGISYIMNGSEDDMTYEDIDYASDDFNNIRNIEDE